MDDNQPEYWDAEKLRPKMQLVLQIDSQLGAVPERVDASDDGVRRLFIGDSGDLNKAVKSALAQAGTRSIQRGGALYVCNTGMRPAKRKGARDARTFQAAYQAPTSEMIARLDAKRPQIVVNRPQGDFFGGAPAAPVVPPAPFAGQPSAAPWQPQAAPVASLAPPVQQPQYQQAAAAPVSAPPTQAPPPAQVQQAAPLGGSAAGTPNPFAAPAVAPAAPEPYPGQAAAAQTPPWAQPGYVPGQPVPQTAVPPNPFQQ